MAELISELPVRDYAHRGPAIYPWDEWLDGLARAVSPGVDFNCTPQSFRQQAHRAARRCGLKVQTRLDEVTGVVSFQVIKDDVT